jgi:hypothetical protein
MYTSLGSVVGRVTPATFVSSLAVPDERQDVHGEPFRATR